VGVIFATTRHVGDDAAWCDEIVTLKILPLIEDPLPVPKSS
jgi:hypothetical protein